jgi:hypothetical protein
MPQCSRENAGPMEYDDGRLCHLRNGQNSKNEET